MSDEQTGADAYAIVLADLYKQRGNIDAAIQAIESLRGNNLNARGPVAETRLSPPTGATERQDYLGLSIAEATKKLLNAQRRTLTSSEIAEGLASAGYPMTAAEPGNVVGSVLSRRFESVGDVVRVSRGQWGLPEWYPNRSFRKKDRDSGTKTPAPPEGRPFPPPAFNNEPDMASPPRSR